MGGPHARQASKSAFHLPCRGRSWSVECGKLAERRPERSIDTYSYRTAPPDLRPAYLSAITLAATVLVTSTLL